MIRRARDAQEENAYRLLGGRNAEFSYSALCRRGQRVYDRPDGFFSCRSEDGNFILLSYQPAPIPTDTTDISAVETSSIPEGGWKLHIAIGDWGMQRNFNRNPPLHFRGLFAEPIQTLNQTNLGIAWNVLKDILIEFQIRTSKVVVSGHNISYSYDLDEDGRYVPMNRRGPPPTNIFNPFENIVLNQNIAALRMR